MKISKQSAGILVLVLVITSGFFAYALLTPNEMKQSDSMDSMGATDHSGMGHGGSATVTDGKTLSADDAMFLQMMIPHHTQAVVMAEYALKNSKNEQILKIAQQIKADQDAEITQMSKWLTDDGQSTKAGHSMAGMSGMLTDAQLNTLKSSTGSSFDKLFLNKMIEHHEGALQMVAMITNSKVAALRDFAAVITKAQQAEIDQMQKMLSN